MKEAKTPPRVVILGAGFGGLAAAKRLAHTRTRVILIDRTNHHLFQPLLYQVATGGLAAANIALPIRSLFRGARNVEIFMDDVRAIDPERQVVIGARKEFAYDHLIVATGARHSYFGRPEWEKRAPGLKTIADALKIRRRIFAAFEEAELAQNEAKRQAALTFVIVGAGPTGVEMAGAMAEIAFKALQRDFRHFDPADARLIVVDALDRVLPTFHPEISQKAHRILEKLRIEVRLNTMVKEVTPEGVQAGETFIAARNIIWAAGNEVAAIYREAGLPVDKAGRVEVKEDLTVPGHPEIQVVGDAALFTHQNGQPLPGLAPVAMQQGQHAARNIRAGVRGWRSRPFRYKDRGMMAMIGRRAAVADVGVARFNGYMAWLSWVLVHLYFLRGGHNRILVALKWAWSYFSFEKEARLITPAPKKTEPPRAKKTEPRKAAPTRPSAPAKTKR